jgi:hypothetical protein
MRPVGAVVLNLTVEIAPFEKHASQQRVTKVYFQTPQQFAQA